MENASKALIIAAAILIAILLISVGVYVVGVAQEQFNQKFTKYLGDQKGSAIRTMVQEVMAYNNSDQASDETMVSINVDNGKLTKKGNDQLISLAASSDVQPSYGTGFKNTKTYTVSIQYNKGRVAVIDIVAKE